ncbi:hypothetical protein B0H17DRAFT_1257414 [Mycena rosella]|uniref:DUF6699 domain-containing protein n=1 Tax=Mycena rosella TaxID=1033263 RepID=A0AAD7CTR6_MYCRO|nr:hypothetical protein B0H17DRAFT_1257414 [Mycena rosella]
MSGNANLSPSYRSPRANAAALNQGDGTSPQGLADAANHEPSDERPRTPNGPLNAEATGFWPSTLGLHDTNIANFLFGQTVGGPEVFGPSETELAARIERVQATHAEANENGDGPPSRHRLCRWTTGHNAPAALATVPWPSWTAGIVPAPNQSAQNPVVIPRNRTVHLPFIPAHKWGTLYGPQRPASRASRRPIMTAMAPPQFFMPMHQPQMNPLNPDLSGPMNWRIFLPPGTARMSRRSTGPILQAPATSPPCFNVAITFENPSLMHWAQHWGPIRVPVHSRTINVGDVLDAIYSYASQPLTQVDLPFVAAQDRKKIEEGRVLRQMHGYPNVRQIPLRSDVFNNSVVFGGLRLLSMSGQGAYLALRLFPDW